MRCPRCRRAHMFTDPNPWHLKKTLSMHEKCSECGQHFELEIGFWWGTGYVSYLLSVVYMAISFVIWWLVVGFSLHDHRFFFWLICTPVSLVALQPWLMRFSRALYLYFFVKYNENYKNEPVVRFT